MSKSDCFFGLLCLLPGVWVGAQERPVGLRAEAMVRGETILLSDLLPDHVIPSIRSSAERISLGRAPEPGSFRVFSAVELRQASGGEMRLEFPAQAIVYGAGWPLQTESVRRGLSESEGGRRKDLSGANRALP